jgi:5-methylcytosine-specific restriction endonuclease McrBC regulatory subunit McrC
MSIEGAFEAALRSLVGRVATRVSRGLTKEYVTRVAEGRVPRGRLRFRESALAFGSGKTSVVWDDRALTTDVPDNRLIAHALRRASRLRLADLSLKAEVIRLERVFASFTTAQRFGPQDYLGRSYTRLSADYAAIHAVASLVVMGTGPTAEFGSAPFLPFGIDVPAVFEQAVFNLLSVELPQGIKAVPKLRVPLGGGLTFVPDMVLQDERGNVKAVLDTKYKYELSISDVQQVVAYSAALSSNDAILVSPRAPEARLRAGTVDVHLVTFDLSLPVSSAADRLARSVAEILSDRGNGVREAIPSHLVQRDFITSTSQNPRSPLEHT